MENVHDIPLSEAAVMTAAYRTANPGKLIGGLFTKAAVELVLDQPLCVDFRFYFALKANGDQTIVLVGVDAAGNDLDTGQLAEYGLPAPPNKGNNNPLNS